VTAGYAFDQYTTALVASFAAEATTLADRPPVDELWIWISQGQSLPELVVARIAGEEVLFVPPDPAGELLKTVLFDDEDPFVDALNERYELAGGAAELYWGDYTSLPSALLNRELVYAAKDLEVLLRATGLPVGAGFRCGLLIDDEWFTERGDFEPQVRARLAALPEAARTELVAASYANPIRAAWLD
jgi:hypothetical protein